MEKETFDKLQKAGLTSGSTVVFRLADAICPGVDQALGQMGPDVEVCGEVAFFSDRGEERAHFAIISAAGIDTPLIVPVSKLEVFSARSRNGSAAPHFHGGGEYRGGLTA